MRFPLRHARSILQLCGCHSLALLLAAGSLRAQVQYDGSLGKSGMPGVSAIGGKTNYQILATDGQLRGSNLFHSFSKFDLSSSEAATFLGPATVRNILARVTSGTASSIDGGVSSAIPGANLFLMNPNGIIFGPNASVDVSGSFFATTASYIRLGNDGRFAASLNARDSVLTTSDPSAFGFLTPNPAAIQVNSSKLTSPNVKTLGFVGGDVSVTGDAVLQAQDVQMISVHSTGEAALRLPTDTNGLRYPSIDAESFTRHGAVTVGQPTVVGALPPPQTSITANRVVIRGGTLAMANTQVIATATQAGDGIHARASESMALTDGALLFVSVLGDLHSTDAIKLTAPAASISGGAFVATAASPGGLGGHVHLAISGQLIMDAATIATFSSDGAPGGDVIVEAGEIAAQNFSSISTFGAVGTKGGDVRIAVAGTLSLTGGAAVAIPAAAGEKIEISAGDVSIDGPTSGIFTNNFAVGPGTGSIGLQVANGLAISNGGMIKADTIGTGGDGASIDIAAASVSIVGENTGISAQNNSALAGRGGDIRLHVTGSVALLEGGTINTNTSGPGSGGLIEISAGDLTVAGLGAGSFGTSINPRGITAQNLSLGTTPAGPSGDIRLLVNGRLEVRDGGEVLVGTKGAANGGSLTINASELHIIDGGNVNAGTVNAGNGGSISAVVGDFVISGPGSRLATISDVVASGNGGNIAISAGNLRVLDGGVITAETLGTGAGGNIEINGNRMTIAGANSMITATSDADSTGRGGDVRLSANYLEITDGGQITASTSGLGAGGSIEVIANTVLIVGSDRAALAGISAQTLSFGAGGPGGVVRIDTQSLEMSGAGAAITTQSSGTGSGGTVQITADTLSMADHSFIASSSIGTGPAGSVSIEASGDITLRGGSSISVASAISDAGDIGIRSGSTINLTDSNITAQAALNGGNVDLRAHDLLFLTNSQITAAAGLNGGNIFIDPQFVVLEDSLISANAIRGRGGNIRIISDFFLSNGSAVTATSELGIDGTVQIDALHNDLTGSLVELPSSLLNAESLLRELCTVKIDKFSSFISEGRGGLPPLPGEALPSLMIVP